MTQANVPFNLGKPDLSDRGAIDRDHAGEETCRESQEETWLTLILSATFFFGILRVKAVTRRRDRLYGIPIEAMEIGWKGKWLETKGRKMWLESAILAAGRASKW